MPNDAYVLNNSYLNVKYIYKYIYIHNFYVLVYVSLINSNHKHRCLAFSSTFADRLCQQMSVCNSMC